MSLRLGICGLFRRLGTLARNVLTIGSWKWLILLRRRWSQLRLPIRATAYAGLAVSASSAAFGWIGEATGKLQDHPYWTNVLSSVTGASIGIPVAVIAISELTYAHAEDRERRKARNLATRAAETFRSSLASIAGEERLSEFMDAHRAFVNYLKADYRNSVASIVINQGEIPADVDKERISEAVTNLAALFYEVKRSLPLERWENEWWLEVEQSWMYLRDVVRPVLFELDEWWLPPKMYARINDAMEKGSPFAFMANRGPRSLWSIEWKLATAKTCIRDDRLGDASRAIFQLDDELFESLSEPWGEQEFRRYLLDLMGLSFAAWEQFNAARLSPEELERVIFLQQWSVTPELAETMGLDQPESDEENLFRQWVTRRRA